MGQQQQQQKQVPSSPPEMSSQPLRVARPMSAPTQPRSRAARRRLKEVRQEHEGAMHQHDMVKWMRQHKLSHKTESTIQKKRNLQTWFASLASASPELQTTTGGGGGVE